MIFRQFLVGIFPGIAAGQRYHTNDTRIGDQFRIGIGDIGNGHLKHQLGIFRQFCQMFHNILFQDFFCFCLIRAFNIYFRFEDGDQAGRRNLQADFKLLVYDLFNACFVGFFNYAAHLGPEDMPFIPGPGQ